MNSYLNFRLTLSRSLLPSAMAKNTKHRQGDLRADGMFFWGYYKHMPNGEYWVTREKYLQNRERIAKRHEEKRALGENRYTPESRARNLEAVRVYRRKQELKAERAYKASLRPRLPKTINLWALENDPDFDLYQPPKQKPVLSDG